MWPQTLEMSDEDCRGTLRRLELETYANVVGVFRAQGGLSDKKVKLLEELRNIFHISQDRHRAEARRVANDEYLSTIAKVVSGPNTWQEWSREGRRSYPLLPRVAPQTALGWIANNLAAEAVIENSKLPYPAETAAAAKEEQNVIKAANSAAEAAGFRYHDKYVVQSDPFKLPDIPTVGAKKNLKRSNNDGLPSAHASVGKKRQLAESAPSPKQKHITATNATHSGGGNRRTISDDTLLRQRYFYQQQQKAKKLAKAANKREKPQGTGKLGRKPKKLKELEQRQQREREQQEQYVQQDYSGAAYENQLMQRMDHADYALSTNIANVMIDMGNQVPMQGQHQYQPHDGEPHYVASGNQKSLYVPMVVPQIAASKRDITRNLTKLQIPAQISTSPTAQISKQHNEAMVISMASTTPTPGTPATTLSKSSILIGSKANVDGRNTPLSTPVQKYIVEDRQPNMTPASASALPPSLLGQQTTSSQFIAGLSQSKLRPISTTILPAGTKLTSSNKKISSTAILSPGGSGGGGASSPLKDNILSANPNSTAQIFNLVEGTTAVSNQANISQPTPPTHTPPAVIQIHNSTPAAATAVGTTSSTQSKVLTTKILPIVLSNNSTKADAAKNGAAAIVSVSTANLLTNSPGASIIKGLPASLLVSGQHGTNPSSTASSGTVFSNLGSATGSPIYRKHPNILRSSSTTAARQLQNSTATKSGGPKILSNIRLTPAISSTAGLSSPFSVVSTSLSSTTQPSIFQHQLRTVPSTSTGIRTSVKICQSPNGKVFIQPANLSKLSGSHRLLPSTILGSSGVGSGSGANMTNKPGSSHIAIKKVQIIPAPLSGTSFGNASNTTQQRLATTTLALGNSSKGSIVGSNLFMQTRNVATTTGSAISLGGGNKATISSGGEHLSGMIKSSNVVVIDASSGKPLTQHAKIKTATSHLENRTTNIENSQMITEDTPVDIIVDDDESARATANESSSTSVASAAATATSSTSSSSITAVLASNLVSERRQQQKQTTINLPMTVLDDWEMEIDQQNKQQSQHQQQIHQLDTNETIIIDDSFEDVIIEEDEDEAEEGEEVEEQEDTTATESEHYDSEDQQLNQQQQQQIIDYQSINDRKDVVILQQKSLSSLEGSLLTKKSAEQQLEGETNYESVPMCIEESIETTHIDGGGNREDRRLSETESADVSFASSSGNENAGYNNTTTDILQSENKHCFESDDASQKSNVTTENVTDDQTEEEESSPEYNNTEEGNIQLIKMTTPKTDKHTATINSTPENEIADSVETTKATKVSASLLTVKDYDHDDDDDDGVADMDTNAVQNQLNININERTKTAKNFDVTDEAKSNQQSETPLNTQTTE